MDDARKKIIVNEIIYWKQNKLLPETYCNYLLTLYTEGDKNEQDQEIKNFKKKFRLVQYLLIIQIGLCFPLLASLGIINVSTIKLLLLTLLTIIAQAAIVTTLIKNKNLFKHISVVVINLYLMLNTVLIIDNISDKTTNIYIGLLICCIIWYIQGKYLKLLYLKIASILGIILMAFNIIKNLI
ncbi:MAG: hypothetical protein K0S34_1375 [Bacillales bacterium]|jgi:hypothetical protein|nr:hypothetical protein [Bacillales bacterium]